MLVIAILMIIGALIAASMGIPPEKGAIIALICLLIIYFCIRDNTNSVKEKTKRKKRIIETRSNRQSKYGFETPYYTSKAEAKKKKERAQKIKQEEAEKKKRLIKKANELNRTVMDILEDLFAVSDMSSIDNLPEKNGYHWSVGGHNIKYNRSNGLVIRCQEDEYGKFYLSMKNDRGDCIDTNRVKTTLEKHTGLRVEVER